MRPGPMIVAVALAACGDATPKAEDAGTDDAAADERDSATASCARPPETLLFEHAGEERRAVVAAPEVIEAAAPLVLVFHGYTSNPEQQIAFTGLDVDAVERGAIVAHLGGLDASFNAGACCGKSAMREVDDVGAVLAVVDAIADATCVDRDRVFAAGMSNGGMLSYRLACEHTDVFAAVASVAGTLVTQPCEPTRPIPALHIHGTHDTVVPWNGNANPSIASVDETIAHWRNHNGCSDDSESTYQKGDSSCVAYAGCDAAVELCTVEAGGHTWPSGSFPGVLGRTTNDLDANQAILDFFAL